MTEEECSRFLAATPKNLYPVYFTFLSTGMRKAELEHLRWSDIDLANRKYLSRKNPTGNLRQVNAKFRLAMIYSKSFPSIRKRTEKPVKVITYFM